ncbi:sugar ABC transporter ATP-binding protein [Kribbella ginsengisoli]|uniref:Autoinducer 2 import ATP-binding protein LsrA n=1 Tax=Kribbella ginsengisoli TaxID=363865 RepID=A0ABP6Z723_9ACTN
MGVPILRAGNCSKRFDGRLVLDRVGIEVWPGEVHALVGQNGSGKSTLIKILAGYHPPEPGGWLELNGEPASLPISHQVMSQRGVAFVHQDLGLNEAATVMENLGAGRYDRGALAPIGWRKRRRVVGQQLEESGLLGVRPETLVADLAPVDRTILAIVRAMSDLRQISGGLLVLDEPTANLPRDGIDRLFLAVGEITSRGSSVLFVSHNLDEVLAVSRRVTVLRDGKYAGTYETSRLTNETLSELILGFKLDKLYPSGERPTGALLARVARLSGQRLEPLTFEVRAGQIVGFTGLLGSGHDDLPYLLTGASPIAGGQISVGDKTEQAKTLTPRKAIQLGVVLVPADRTRDAVLGSATATENLTLPTLRRYFRRGRLRRHDEQQRTRQLCDTFEVKPADPGKPMNEFSGGNQQKLILAKWMETEPSVLVLHEPTHGVDVGSRKALFGQILEIARKGVGVVLCSTEHEDLVHLCDRLIILRRGRKVAELSGQDIGHEQVLELIYGPDRRVG